jgi:hypothetical protein
MKKLIFTLTASLWSVAIFAAVVTWNGTTGNWNTAANWSTGTVPTAADDVIIPSGYVNIWGGVLAYANSVEVQVNGTLNIRLNGSLTVGASTLVYAVRNYNKLIVSGLLSITDLTGLPNFGIMNYDTLDFRQSGVVEIDGFQYSIDNWSYAKNLGLVELVGAEYGIQQFLSGIFTNGQTGTLNIAASIYCIKNQTNSVLTNDGIIDLVRNGAIGYTALHNQNASFTNNATGNMIVSNAGVNGGTGIGCVDNGTFTNRGILGVHAVTGLAVSNFGGQVPGPTFNNTTSGVFDLNTNANGILLQTNPTFFINSGHVDMIVDGGNAITNASASFVNSACADMVLHGNINNQAGGTIQNYGAWYMDTTTPSTNAGSFQNVGIVEDNAAGLYPLITNSRLVVRSITGPLVAGVPVGNVLNVASWGTFQSLGIFTDAVAVTSAGTYVQATNTLTPNAAAVGLPSLYIKIRRGNNGCTEIFRIDVLNPVPIVMPGGETNVLVNSDQFQPDFSVFPNPTTGRFSLRGMASNGLVEVIVADAFGRIVLRQNIDFQEVETYQFETGQLPGAGLYVLKIMENGATTWQEKLLVTGH